MQNLRMHTTIVNSTPPDTCHFPSGTLQMCTSVTLTSRDVYYQFDTSGRVLLPMRYIQPCTAFNTRALLFVNAPLHTTHIKSMSHNMNLWHEHEERRGISSSEYIRAFWNSMQYMKGNPNNNILRDDAWYYPLLLLIYIDLILKRNGRPALPVSGFQLFLLDVRLRQTCYLLMCASFWFTPTVPSPLFIVTRLPLPYSFIVVRIVHPDALCFP